MMRSRHGFALIAVLWLLTVLGGILIAGGRSVRLAIAAAENRGASTRARWAARSCLAVALARSDLPEPSARWDVIEIDSLAMGPDAWCRLDNLDPSRRIDPNVTDSVGLVRALGSTVLAASLLDWVDPDGNQRSAGAEAEWYRHHRRPLPRNGPIRDVREIADVRGFESWTLAALEEVFTTWGNGGISVNTAPDAVLRSLSLLPADGIERLLGARAAGTWFVEVGQVARIAGVEATVSAHQALAGRLILSPTSTVVRATGSSRVRGVTIRSQITAMLVAGAHGVELRRVEVR